MNSERSPKPVFRARRPRSGEVWAIVLAAGASRRMGRSKALISIHRRSFLERIVECYHQLDLPVCVVLAPNSPARPLALSLAVKVLENPQPERGPLSSFRLALGLLRKTSGVLVHPVDHPLVRASSIDELRRWHGLRPDCMLIPVCQGRKGHPVLFPRRFFSDLESAPLEVGARWVVHRHQSSVLWVPVHDPGVLANLNTPDQLSYWSRRSNRGVPGAGDLSGLGPR